MLNPDIQIGAPFLVRSTVIPGTSYTNGDVFSMDAHNAIGLTINYVKGWETSLEIRIQVSNDGGVTYAQQSSESTSGGTITVSLSERTFSATGVDSVLVNPVRA